ncbi:Phosphatidylinositol-4-phosphate 5-Kinase family protein [Leishmania donovani]|uniref:Phosphatidylinositol-4-phosphate 5-Kinase family protein n=1 Tax=Leishmania donovani TaxID=5661 RepID=A0A504X938_LEIDO|nr:Phosphatidylinositol-4-phosphate 5-Kinase family protein [Leishmania donovani]
MESRDAPAKASVDGGTDGAVPHDCEDTVPPPATPSARTNETEKDLQLRRLRRENHLLRLQLLKLREQQHQLLANTSAAAVCPVSDSALAVSDVAEAAPQQARSDIIDEEATALRTRMLQRIRERQQRTTVARSLLRDAEQLYSELPQQEQLEAERGNSSGTATPVSPASPPVKAAPAQSMQTAAAPSSPAPPPLAPAAKLDIIEDGCDQIDQRHALLASPSSATASRAPADKSASSGAHAAEDLSAEAMLQRFQDRKSQRRLRLEQMLGPIYDAAGSGAAGPSRENDSTETAPLGAVPRGAGAGQGGEGAQPPLNRSVAAWDGRGKRIDSGTRRGRENGHKNAAATATSAYSGPTRNPNQIGRAVSDAVKNNSWYLCKVLEAALLDTIQARPANDAAAPALSSSPEKHLPHGSHSRATDTALKRAIEESLLLPFRCVQDAPRRLTSSQAAEESLPAFEAENRDAELRRCFAEGAGKDALLSSGARRDDDLGSTAAGNDDEEAPERESDMLGAHDDNLDPFARLLLARLSTDLPSKTTKSDWTGKHLSRYGSGKDGAKQSSLASRNASAASSPTNSKAGVAFVAAASGDRRVHVPKKHFSRLDEVQVEMHAPVIFNQIRDFLRMDVERFRRSFAPTSSASQSDADSGEGADRRRWRAAQTQQRLRVGSSAGADETTAWRITVSPGKSGTTLLYFSDFVMKTVRPREMEFLLRKFLPAYVRYCERNPHTLLPRFYALATLRWWKAGVVQHFVLMQNVFATPYYIHRIYDVKGSTVNRTALQPGKPPPRTAFGALLLKDNDLPPQLIICGTYQRAIVLAQLRSDVGFLRQLNVVDYSCMIGVRSRLFSSEEGPSKTLLLLRRQHHDGHVSTLGSSAVATQGQIGQTCSEVMYATDKTAAADGAGISVGAMEPTLPPFSVDAQRSDCDDDVYVCIHGCDGGLLSLPIHTSGDDTTAREEVYYLGIIDVLQTYNSVKKLESFAKGFVNDRRAISVIAPDKYAERLYKVLERITSGALTPSPSPPKSPPHNFTPDTLLPTPFRLEEAPVYRDDWARQHPFIHLLFHRDIITRLVWCAAACRYLTGGADGAVKLWRSELQPRVSSSHATSLSSAERPALIPEVHVVTLGGPVTDLRTSGREVGNSEVAVIASTDGTLTLCRTGTGETIRTLRGARGESLERCGAVAATGSGPTRAGSGREDAIEDNDNGALAEGSRQFTQRTSKVLAWYAADAYSYRLAPSSDTAFVRRPVYTVRAYRNEAREARASPSNEYFQGLRTVAPTYEHLAPHEMMIADVLMHFSVAKTSMTSTHTSTMPRQWYACAIALAAAPAVIHTSNIGASSSSSQSALDPLLLLGFPQGLVQVYVLPQRWFALHQHGETRLDPPAVRVPVFSGLLHSAAVLCIEVIVSRDVVVSVSEDGTTQLRRLSCLRAPLRQLNVVVSLPTPMSRVPPSSSMPVPPRASALRQRVGSAHGHSRLVTCCCVDAEQQLLITGSADHTLCWWSLMLGSSSTPIRIVSLRDTATTLVPRGGADGTSSSPSSPPSMAARGGYPVDVSLFRRKLLAECHNEVSPDVVSCDDAGSSTSLPRGFQVGLFLLVLDTERVVRIFDALSGKLITYEIESRAAAVAVSSGPVDSVSGMAKDVRLARYDGVNGADRVLLGGLCLVPWYPAHAAEFGVTRGHTASIIFTAWCSSLKCVVTADAHHVLLWRLPAGRQRNPTAQVLRAWRIAAGVRSVALCDTEATDEPSHLQQPSLFIAHGSEPVIGQYDCLLRDSSPEPGTGGFSQPRLLRQLSLRVGTGVAGASVDALAAVNVVARTANVTHAGSAAGVVTTYALAACHAMRGMGYEESHAASEEGRLYMYPLRLSRATTGPEGNHAPVTVDGATELIAPVRELHLSDWRADDKNSIVSVLGLPCVDLLVVGGRRVLYTAPLSSAATSAVPCDPLPPGWAVAQQLNWRVSNLSMRAPRPTAVFPGPLILLDDSTILELADEEAETQANSSSVAVVELVDSSLAGFLSRLVHIPHDTAASAPDSAETAVCLVLSGSNDGLVQLWDVQHGRELWQCRAVPTREPITALAVHQYAARWLVAAGDQSGVVTLLDITTVLQAARQVVAADAQTLPKPAASTTGWCSRHGLVGGKGRMLDRWLAHADAVSGAFFTTVPADVGGAAVTAPQLLTTGEDSVVMLWELPSWALPSAPNVALNSELSGIPLFRPGEGADQSKRRRYDVPVRVQPSMTKLPRAARQAYEPWRQQYVRERLLGGEDTELSAALTRFYMHNNSWGGMTASDAWAVLAADVRAFAQLVDPVEPQGDAPAAAPRPRTVVHAWCASLLPDATAEIPTATLSSSPPAAKHRSHRDEDRGNTCCESATLPFVPSGTAGRAAPLPSPLILAFADRCCAGRSTGGHRSVRHRRLSECETGASSVRERLRQVLRVVVQNSVGSAPSQCASGALTGMQPKQSTPLGPSLLPSVADRFASADDNTPSPPPLLPEGASPVIESMPCNIEVVNSEMLGTPPASAPISTAPGESFYGVTPNGLSQQVARHGATPRRQLGFTDESGEPRSTQPPVPTAPFQNQLSRVVVAHRSGYGVHAQLVRRASADRRPGVTAEHGRLLRSKAPGKARHAAMSGSATAPHLLHERFVDADGDLGTEANASHRCLAGGGVAATVMQQVNHHRRREEALQRLITLEQADLGTAGNKTAERKRKLSGAAVSHPALRSGTKSGSPQLRVVNPPTAAQVLVSDAYLTPVLRRVGASSALLPDHAAAAQKVTTSIAAASVGSAFVPDSANSAWYVERQRRRDAAREKARLWNSKRVMKTLLEWTTQPVESCSGVAEALRTTEGCVEDGHTIALSTKAATVAHGNARTTAGSTASRPVLDLPPILTLPHSTDSALFPAVKEAIESPDAAAAALTNLLWVSPTTAIDVAVRHGLPSRKTLQAEMAAAKMRMRQSVRARAAYQREHRAMAVEADDDSDVNVAEELGSGDTDSLSEEQRGPDKVASAGGTSQRSHESQTMSHHAIPVSASILPLGKSGCTPRRALQPHDGAEPRRMATVPLPIATTRQELFGCSTPRRK